MSTFNLQAMAAGLQTRTQKLQDWRNELDEPFSSSSAASMDSSAGWAGYVPVVHAGLALEIARDLLATLHEACAPQTNWSTLILTRGILFNAAHILWLVGPSDTWKRQVRGVIDAHEDLKNAKNLDDASRQDDPKKGAPVILIEKRRRSLEGEIKRLNLQVNDRGSVIGHSSLNMTDFLSSELNLYLPDADGVSLAAEAGRVWRLLSGVDHGYATASIEAGGRAYGQLAPSNGGKLRILLPVPNSSAVALTLLIYTEALERFARYVGCQDKAVFMREVW